MRFIRTTMAFALGLGAILAVFERTAVQRIEARQGASLIVRDIYPLTVLSRVPSQDVQRVYLGDSVARQFYPAGTEPDTHSRFLTSNGGLGVAGNYYLLEDTFRSCPNARDVVLMVRPETLQVNLDPPVANDYFCGLFHSSAQVAEAFDAKRDLRLTAIHAGRWAMPATMAINSAWRQPPEAFMQPFVLTRGSTDTLPSPAPNTEQILTWASRAFGGPRAWTPAVSSTSRVTKVELSPTGSYYLARMRALCASRGGTLRVLASPYPVGRQWDDPSHVYDAPFFYLPDDDFGDDVHVGPPNVWLPTQVGSGVAQRLASAYGLPDLAVRHTVAE